MYNVTCEFGREHKRAFESICRGVWLLNEISTMKSTHGVCGIDDEVSETICILWANVLGSLHKDPLECVLPYRPGCIPIFHDLKYFIEVLY